MAYRFRNSKPISAAVSFWCIQFYSVTVLGKRVTENFGEDLEVSGNQPFSYLATRDKWNLLGTGKQGSVYKVEVVSNQHTEHGNLQKGTFVAVKVTGKGDRVKEQAAKREWDFLSKLNDPNIVTVYDYLDETARGGFGSTGSLYLVMEFLPDMRPFFGGKKGYLENAATNEAICLWHDLVNGYKASCKAGILQKDKNPDNRVVSCSSKSCTAKIIDLGFGALTGKIETNFLMKRRNEIGFGGAKPGEFKLTCSYDVKEIIKSTMNRYLTCSSCVWKGDPRFRAFTSAVSEVLKEPEEKWAEPNQAEKLYDRMLNTLQC